MRKIKKIVVHCTASSDSIDIGFREIDEWHRQRGFLSDSGISCGYHWIIRRDGRVEQGRPEIETGAHAKGHNHDSIGVVWVGEKQIGQNQYKQLLRVIRGLMDNFDIDIMDVVGHNELPDVKKACPVISMHHLRGDLLFTGSKEEIK